MPEPLAPLPSRVLRLREAAERTMLAPDGRRVARFVCSAEEYLEKEALRVASYRETVGQPPLARRTAAFRRLCERLEPRIRDGELIVGSQRGNVWWPGLTPAGDPTYPERHKAILGGYRDLGVAFGEGHVVCDYERVLKEGLRGQVERIGATAGGVPAPGLQWAAMREVCEAARTFARRHGEAARLAAEGAEDARAQELHRIADICERVPWGPARSFHEALQSFWFLHVLLHHESPSYAISPGRLDQFLYPYYRADLDAGTLTHAEAAELLGCLWLKFWEGEESQNVAIGGVDCEGEDATNALSYLMLDLTGDLRAFQPSLSVRIHRNTPAEFLRRACDLAVEGTGQPSFFSDEALRPALEGIGVPHGESWDYAIVGCYEATIAGCEWGRTVAGGVQLPHMVLRAFDTQPESWDALLSATRREIAAEVARMAEWANGAETWQATHAPSPFESVLLRDCIARGLDCFSGGARHNPSACWLGGLATGVDSLFAVKRLVFEEGALTLWELRGLLGGDFGDAEDRRRQLLQGVPKFGNDDDQVDALARELCELFCDEVARQRNPRGGCFQASLGMFQVHYGGLQTGATPDGRHANTPFAAGVGPSAGCNIHGATATLRSCAKLPHDRAPNGNFLLISMPPDLVRGPRDERGRQSCLPVIPELIRSYFDEGGSHLMMNVVDAATLRDAQVRPELHRDVMVRISGLSAYFVTLDKHVQDDIIARTEKGL